MEFIEQPDLKIAVIGLGYVGLPLAFEFAKKNQVIGFDINQNRIKELNKGFDRTKELETAELNAVDSLLFTSEINDLADCHCYIIAVPTPVDPNKVPDLSNLRLASEMVGTVLSDGNVVVYESTVFPGATEDICLPILEGESGLLAHKDKREHQKVFYLGYSPERINPGDKARKISDIVKVVSGSSEFAAGAVECLYKRIISAGTFKVSCIKVAEAAKIIENTQRDLNIALINECAKIFHLMSIDTKEVISAAATKWNFIPFYPGLVGGHCIGVDPYYLTYKAKQLGYDPKVILAGRDLNDTMDAYCALRISNSLNEKKGKSEPPKVLVMGISFKENCPDMRNSLATGLVVQLREYDYNIDVYDPWVELSEPLHGTVFLGNREPRRGEYDLIIIAVAHQCFIDLGIESIREYGKESCYIFDLKHVFDKTLTDDRL